MARGSNGLRTTSEGSYCDEDEEPQGKKERARRTIQVDGVYDIETEARFGRFLVGGYYDGQSYVERDWRLEVDLAATVTATDGHVWAHNGGVFDAKWLLELLRNSGAKARVRAAGARIVSLRSGGVESLDSKALSKLSLRDFSRGVGVEKTDTGLACLTPESCGPWCGGYCRFRRGMRSSEWNSLREYLRADCVSLWQSLERLQGWADEHDIDLAATVGAASFSHARRMLGLPDASLTLEEHRFAREAYYGGRVEEFREEAGEGYEYDVNAMYSAAGKDLSMPLGEPRTYGHGASGRHFRAGSVGIYRARVSVPDMWIPPLPARIKGRTAFPVGTFEGTWTSLELQYAVSLGVKVDIKGAIVWPHSQRIFGPWVDKLWALRSDPRHGGKTSPFGIFIKYLLNSLWGKFGSQPENDGFVVNPDEITEHMAPIGQEVYRVESGAQRYRGGRWVAGSPCCHVEWAAFVTSWARVEWHKEATSVADGLDLIYCDTDSLFCLRPRTRRVGMDCGYWKPEPRFQRMSVLGPKFYRVQREGHWKVKSKGVHATFSSEWDQLWESGSHRFEWDSSMGFKMAARKGAIFAPQRMARKVKRGYGTRIPMSDGTGRTRPPTAKELGIEA